MKDWTMCRVSTCQGKKGWEKQKENFRQRKQEQGDQSVGVFREGQ